jgi:Arc/MetJ-type ribon-helix-helix transcriptional regulator
VRTVQGEWLDDEALRAAVRDWEAAEDADAYRVQWMLDQAAAGRMTPAGDDMNLFALVELLKLQGRQASPEGRQRAFNAMMAEADKRGEDDGERDPARIEQTHQAMLAAFQASMRPKAEGEGRDAS